MLLLLWGAGEQGAGVGPRVGMATRAVEPLVMSPWLLSLWYFTTKLVTALDSALVRLNLHRHRHLLCRTDSRNRCRSRRRNWQSPCRIASLYTCSLRHSQRYTCAGSTGTCPMLAHMALEVALDSLAPALPQGTQKKPQVEKGVGKKRNSTYKQMTKK